MRKSLLTVALLSSLFTSLVASLSGCGGGNTEEKFSALMTKAEEAKKAEKYEEARLHLQSAIDLKPKDAQAYYEFAEVLIRLQKFGPALENYKTALNEKPDFREARLHLASLLLAFRQYEEAESHINKLMEENPREVETLVLKANLAAAGPRKNLEEAKKNLAAALEIDPKSVPALASSADIAMAEGDGKRAEELFSKALEVEPKNATLRLASADLFSRQGRFEEAQLLVEGLLKENPENSSLRYAFGEFLLQRGKSDDAFGQYEETLKAAPLRHDARDRLYDMYLAKKDVAAARKLTADLEKQAPENPGVFFFQARDQELESKLDAALTLHLKAVAAMPSFGPVFRHAGMIEMALGKTTEAVQHLNQAVTLNAADITSRLALARYYFSKTENSQASEQVNRVLERFPRQLGANILKADIALVEGDLKTAEQIYKLLTEAFPQSPIGPFKLAMLKEKAKSYEDARALYEKVLNFDQNIGIPAQRFAGIVANLRGLDAAIAAITLHRDRSVSSKAEYSIILGALYASRAKPGDQDQARALFTQATELNPNAFPAYMALASLDAAEGKIENSIANYRKVLEKQPNSLPTRMALALMLERKGEFQASSVEYREILKSVPRFGPASNNLAWLVAEHLKGDLEEALKLATVAKEEMPNEAGVADTLGWIHHLRGAHKAAVQYLLEAVEKDKAAKESTPSAVLNTEIVYHLAVAQAAADEKVAAKATAEKALGLSKTSPALQEKIQTLLKTL